MENGVDKRKNQEAEGGFVRQDLKWTQIMTHVDALSYNC